MIAYQDLIYFIELTETLNFSRAAERCGITQPSFSAAIKRLEAFAPAFKDEIYLVYRHENKNTEAVREVAAKIKSMTISRSTPSNLFVGVEAG